ncbi:MAG TPA: hypothetical protein VJL29_10020 [Thermoguttaceae bacterium]|nr:hypothetical protein [Thermoguttaceae bacterium]
MPRIAVAVMVVVIMGVSIGINIARFPIVWTMVNHAPKKVAAEEPTPPVMPAVRTPKEVDLSQFTPPRPQNIQNNASGGHESLLANESAAGSTGALPPEVPSAVGVPTGDTMHLISERSDEQGRQPDRSETPVGSGSVSGNAASAAESAASGAVGFSPGGEPSAVGAAEIAPPIVFGPMPATPIGPVSADPAGRGGVMGFGARPGLGLPDASSAASTTWPAEAAPTLKLGARPLFAEQAQPTERSDQAERARAVERNEQPEQDKQPDLVVKAKQVAGEPSNWHERRPLVPVAWPTHDSRESTLSTASSDSPPRIERLPAIVTAAQEGTSAQPHWPERPPVIYPSTGR